MLFLLFILLLVLQKMLLATKMGTIASADMFSYPKHVSVTSGRDFEGEAKCAILRKIVKFQANFEKKNLLSQQQFFFIVGKRVLWTYYQVWMGKNINLNHFDGFQQMLTT